MSPLPDPDRRPWATRVLGHSLVQPDRLSCGAACLVVARVLTDERYAEVMATSGVVTRFRAEVSAMHRRVTGPVDVRGQLQLPWPRALGTPPWAVARQLGASYETRTVLPGTRHVVHDACLPALQENRPVALFIGNRWLPRHVVLAVAGTGSGLSVYDPAGGRLVEVTRRAFVDAELRLSGWDIPWFVVAPAT
ncbi:MAG: hypothetical protein L0H93_16020 [Nocardioides sp.]|nr:hypothetical protein [Nocardioides sp.]